MSRLRTLTLAAVALPALGCDSGLALSGPLGTALPAALTGWVPAVEVGIDDDAPRRFLVDTGAPLTLLDADMVGRPGPDATVDLSIGPLSVAGLRVPVFDLFPGGGDDEAFAGILGGEVLSAVRLSIDYQQPRVWFRGGEDAEVLPPGVDAARLEAPLNLEAELRGGGRGRVPASCRGPGCEFEVGATRLLVWVRLEGEPTARRFLVDTGASLVVVRDEVLAALPAPGRPRLDGVTVGTAAGPATAYLSRVGEFAIIGAEAEAAATSVAVLVLPDEAIFEALEEEVGGKVDGLIGGSFLREFFVTSDPCGERLGLARYRSSSHLDPNEYLRVGFGLRPEAGAWFVREIYPNTSAAASALMIGDQITAIDGVATAGLGRAEVSALLAGDLGTKIEVMVAATPVPTTATIEIENLLPDYVTP